MAAYDDEVAPAVLAGLRSEGLPTPQDVAVMGVVDIPAARLTAPALTTISRSVEARARHLAASVVAALDGDVPPAPAGSLHEVVVRDTT